MKNEDTITVRVTSTCKKQIKARAKKDGLQKMSDVVRVAIKKHLDS